MRRAPIGPVICLLLAAVFSGCAANRVHRAVPDFAAAVTLTTENTRGAFDAVERKYDEVETARMVVNYDQSGFNPAMVRHLLDEEDIDARVQLLSALQTYAATLEEVSSNSKLEEFDAGTRAMGESLQRLTTTGPFQRLVQNSQRDSNIASTAVNAMGRWFIDRKRNRALPELISEMQEPVSQTVELLRADIGALKDAQGRGGHGLRMQMWNQYQSGMMQQTAFIDQNKDRMDPRTKAEEIAKLRKMVDEQKLADRTLKQTADALGTLEDAHAELLKAVQTKADLRAKITALAMEGQRIKEYYSALQEGE